MAKSLFIFLFFFKLTTYKECGKVSLGHSHMIESHSVMSHDITWWVTWWVWEIVHRPCSSCISSIENLIGTPLSFPC